MNESKVNISKLTPVSACDSNTIVCRATKPGSIMTGPTVTLRRRQCGFDINLQVIIQLGEIELCVHDAPFTREERDQWLALYDSAALAEDRRRGTMRTDAVHILRDLGVF